MDIDCIRENFYAGVRGPEFPLCANDCVEVISGEHAGRRGALISLESVGDDPTYLVEFGDTGADTLLVASLLRVIEEDSM